MRPARTGGGRRATLWGALLAAALVLTGCGGEDGGGSDSGGAAPTGAEAGVVTTAPGGVQEVTIEVPDDYVFRPDSFTVAPGQVRLTVRSTAEQAVHNFRFTPGEGPEQIAAQVDLLQPGQSETIDFSVTAPGDYPFECSFHVQLGQVGTMTVAG